LLFQGIAVYKSGLYWRISSAGTILRLHADRRIAEQLAQVYAKHFKVKVRVFA